jgi:hypothetical protein
MKKILLSMLSVAALSLSAQTTILSEDFTSGLPTGWTMDAGWTAGTADGLASEYFVPPGSSEILCVNDDAANPGGSGAIVTSEIDLTGQSVVLMSFDAYFVNGDYEGDEEAFVQLSSDGGNTWTTALNLGGVGAWNSTVVDLSDYAGGSVMVSLNYLDDGGWEFGFAIDNFSLFVPADQDAVVTLISPSFQVISSEGEELNFTFDVSSYGALDLSNYSFAYTVDDGAEQTISGADIALTESESFNVTLGFGDYAVDAYVLDASGNMIGESVEVILSVAPPVPNFNMTDTHGDNHDLYNMLSKGDVVVLDFFASWCGPCEISTPEVNSVWEDLGSGSMNFQVFGVTTEPGDNAAVIDALNWGAEYPKFAYSETNGALYNHYNALYGENGIPFFVMICPNESNPGFSDVSWSSVGWAGPEALTAAAEDCDASVDIEEVLANKLSIFPNPASNNAAIELNLVESNEVVIEVVNTLGQKVFTYASTMSAGLNKVELPVATLNAGLFYVNIKVGNELITEKLNILK